MSDYDKSKDYKKYISKNPPPSRMGPQFSNTTTPVVPFEEYVRKIALEAAELLIKKHHDYGPDNINNAPGGAMNGLLVRMYDKMERLKTLLLGNKTPKFESVEDTLIDVVNYALIAMMVQRGRWPKK